MSTTVISGKMDESVWADVANLAESFYQDDERSVNLKKKLKAFSAESSFEAEVPSITGIECKAEKASTVENVLHHHSKRLSQGCHENIKKSTEKVNLMIKTLQQTYDIPTESCQRSFSYSCIRLES